MPGVTMVMSMYWSGSVDDVLTTVFAKRSTTDRHTPCQPHVRDRRQRRDRERIRGRTTTTSVGTSCADNPTVRYVRRLICSLSADWNESQRISTLREVKPLSGKPVNSPIRLDRARTADRHRAGPTVAHSQTRP